ncbi:PucR family transcriptional regulator [Halobacillus massiliensis]|uniref:PucR family transcriptional regulator n=1 Tax=Halobacillus massiliensis TaxID=1926286 RepID=UPI001FE46D78|nr:PucR family transcriptional regulator [Halobacillus massiliensis]
MPKGLELTVNDVVVRDMFNDARLAAGAGGLNRPVKWTHILETQDFDSLINGGELILTTGFGLQLDTDDQQPFQRLIDKGAAGICIEKGEYFSELSEDIAELANQHNFPIIIFEKIVKFVDITQDLHTLIINQHHRKLHELSELTKEFTQLSLSHNGSLKILKKLYDYFGLPVLFAADDVKSYYHPPETKELEELIHAHVKMWKKENFQHQVLMIDNQGFAICPVIGFGQVWGYLCVQINGFSPDDFFFSILDRASLAVAQILLRNRTIEERKLKSEDDLVRNLMEGKEYDRNDLETFLTFAGNNLYYRVIVFKTALPDLQMGEGDWEEMKLKRSMVIRSLFKRHGFFPAVSVRRHEIAVICSFISTEEFKKDTSNFSKLINSIYTVDEKNVLDGRQCQAGVSAVFKDIENVSEHYNQAKDILQLAAANISSTIFYDKAGIYRLLLQLRKSGELEQYVEDYLGRLLVHDAENDSDLLNTLTIYLESGCSKKEAAEKLYIVRQTLYHRLDKIEQLLNVDYTIGVNRLALETAIEANKFMKFIPK